MTRIPPLPRLKWIGCRSAGWFFLWLTGCASPPAPRAPDPPRAVVQEANETSAIPVQPPPAHQPDDGTPVEPLRLTRSVVSPVTIEGVSFDSRSHRLRVIDQPGGPGSSFADAAAAGRASGSMAAINGGFFTPGGEPLGWSISAGRRAGTWNTASSLGSGIWFEDATGRSAIRRREAIDRRHAAAMTELLQAGPMLIDHGQPVTGLDTVKTSARTFLLWDGRHRWWLGRSSPCTLAELARIASRQPPAGWQPRFALNLDGGRSAELWVSSRVPGGPIHRRPAWNRPVRNFLVLQPR